MLERSKIYILAVEDKDMAIVGFNFTKLNIENKGVNPTSKISSDLKILDILPEKTAVDVSNDLVKFQFEFSIDYAGTGSAILAGDVIYLDEPAVIKELLENWQAKKAIKAELLQQILNMVLFRCNIKALGMAQDVNLPPHFQLPRIEKEAENSEKKE